MSQTLFPATAINAASTALVGGLQAVAEALRAACANPADAIRLLTDMVNFVPPPIGTTLSTAELSDVPEALQRAETLSGLFGNDALGVAMLAAQITTSAACRRAALISIALASAEYLPSSYQDAVNVRNNIAGMLDAEATIAADTGDADTYHAFRELRSAVIVDLTARGGSLAMVVTRTFQASMPAAVLAQRLYRDGTRSDDLVARVNPKHPLFFPVSFQCLAS